ncbi:phosphoheptose isomerase [Streptosporangium sp. NPDC000563]|uniref:phosphoheptose isomerase n=1 Tax=Streptosporangium sp. NPDC000563 TaxID=3154366 RepID=UPI00331F2A86
MASRFRLGGKLIVFGDASADAAHIAVEFMHPVIVGKRALPAVALSGDIATADPMNDAGRESDGDRGNGVAGGGEDGDHRQSGDGRKGGGGDEVFAHQVRHWADPADTALGIFRDGRCPSVLRGLEAAGELGLLTIALAGALAGGGEGDTPGRGATGHFPTGPITGEHTPGVRATTGRLPADHILVAASDEPAVVKEVHVTTYHLLWELVHVFLDRLGPPARGADR